MISVGGRRCGVNETLDSRIARRHQHIDEAVDIGGIGQEGILQ